jgi:hypothetical protein
VAAPVVVTDTVTGGPGAYTHTFSLTNNAGGSNTLYFFGVDLSGEITGTPESWASSGNQNANWSNAGYGGSTTNYPNTWCCSFGGTSSGTTTSGFVVESALNPAAIKFFSFATDGVDTNNDGHFSGDYNPGFEGIVGAAVATPEPATWALMIVGFGMVGASMRKRQVVQVAYA